MTTTMLSAQRRPQGRWFGGRIINPHGGRDYSLWLPARYTGKRRLPLVVMLHGCTQTAADFAAGTRMNALADRHGFLVLYPEQLKEDNPLKCWNWFAPEHQTRDKGEPAILADIVKAVQLAHKVDARRVYVAGISAGGAMAVIMAAAYPDMFAAVGVSAGLEYKAATSIPEALAAQKQGGPDPAQQGRLAYEVMKGAPGFAARGKLMPVIVFHGTEDGAVAPANAEQVAAQWVATNDLLDDGAGNSSVSYTRHGGAAGSGVGLHDYEVNIYRDRRGRPLVERWLIKGLRHAWSGGSPAGTFTDPKGPDASAEMWRFFSRFKR